jgi:hypothetical protein
MRYSLLIFFFGFVSIFLPAIAVAAVVANTGTGNWPIIPSGDITARVGNNAIGGPWELSNGVSTVQYVWPNGVNVPFTLSHNGNGLTMTLAGGTSTTWNYSSFYPISVDDIYIEVWSQNATDTVRIDNLVLNGTPVSSFLVGNNIRGFMRIYDDSNISFRNFTLTGTINLAWTGIPPPPQLQARFTVMDWHSLAPGANTQMIALIAFLAISAGLLILRRHRRKRVEMAR